MEQPILFTEKTLEDRFADWLKKHPEAYEHFRLFTLQAIRAGRDKFGAKAIAERMRWYVSMEWHGEKYKINNNFTALLARKFIREYPAYKSFFETRKRRTP